MNSKLISFFLVSFIVCFGLRASAQVRLAVFAGPQSTSAYYTIQKSKQPTDFQPGLMAGIAAKVEFDERLYFFPSIYYSLKGFYVALRKQSFLPTEFAINNDVSVQTVQVAPLLQYDLTKKPSHFFARLGPSVDIALRGYEKFDTVSRAGAFGTVRRPMVFGFAEYGYMTAQANLHFGYETEKGLMVFGFYEHGIGSLNNADRGPKIFHRILGVSVGWFLSKRPIGSPPSKKTTAPTMM